MDFYGTLAAYKAYHTARGRDVSAQTDEAITSNLLLSSEWLDGSFGHRWPGLKVGQRDQVRDWPRSDVYDRAGDTVDYLTVPIEIEQATYEVAFRMFSDPAEFFADYQPSKYSEVAIEGAVRVKYRNMDASTVQKQYPIIGAILSRLIGDRNGSMLSSGIVRA